MQSQRLPREAVAARLARLQSFFDSEVFGGWLSKQGSLERLELLHSVYASDAEFLSAMCGLCLWTPGDLIGDTSVLSIAEPTIIGSYVPKLVRFLSHTIL